MATSPNYGWTEPDNTSLVKDGAQAMRTLGDAIDTSVWNVGFGQAGKNKIINGDFSIWQRGTSVNLTNGIHSFLADRWQTLVTFTAGTASVSRQTFTPGAAPVAGYEGQFFQRLNTGTTASYLELNTKLENVQTFAGQTITVSFWAKASGAFTIKDLIRQNFGSGGSANVDLGGGSYSLTTSWQRFTRTLTLGSLSGKTIGANSFLQMYLFQDTGALGGFQIDIWGVQVEAGSKATPFQTASGGSIQGELAMCQRYYQVFNGDAGTGMTVGAVATAGSQTFYFPISFPVKMRGVPTLLKNGTWGVSNSGQPAVAFAQTSGFSIYATSTASGAWYVQADSTDDTITASAEL